MVRFCDILNSSILIRRNTNYPYPICGKLMKVAENLSKCPTEKSDNTDGM